MKRFTAILLSIFTLFALTACQPTPEATVVVQKDTDRMVEQAANMERIIHWGPRTLDLDILFYDQEIIDMPDLHIPHIDLHNRDFVLVPMNQIAPYLRHPVLNQTISQLLDSLLNKSENTAK